jgi:hypothetical protein
VAKTQKNKKNKQNKKKQGQSRKLKKKSKFTAETADRHELYQLSVQASTYEVDIIERMYKSAYDARPTTMREDFCGTALLCATWVKSDPERTATGVDFCADTLAWGRLRNIEPLGENAKRVSLLQEDVRAERPGHFQVINALNFSYSTFRTREELCGYFKRVHASLETEGLFLCDSYGGWESQEPMLEPREIAAGFTYIWDQNSFDPITHEVVNHIHFEFKDGTKMDKAFTYEWRYWTLPEMKELLVEAGFSEVRVYWDTADDEDEEDYQHMKRAENQPGWLAYIVALK